MSQLVVVIQCDIVTKRCSGYACMNTFANRVDTMADYPADTRFLMMTCGGCCGAGISPRASYPTRTIGRPVPSETTWPRSSSARAIP